MKLTKEQRTQGTPEWLELRKTKITASDIAILMGHGKYDIKTPLQLYNHKEGLTPEQPDNPAMAKGRAMEPLIVQHVEKELSFLLMPDVIVNDFLMASLDGISVELENIVEAKHVGAEVYENFGTPMDIPAHHWWQIVGQFLASPETRRIIYCISNDGVNFKRVCLKREHMQANLEQAYGVAKDFYYNHMLPKIPPSPTDKDRIEVMDDDPIRVATKLEELLIAQDKLKADIETTREQLLALTGERNCDVARIRISVSDGRKTVDYKSLIKDNNIDVTPYEKIGAKVVTIRRTK